MRVREDFSEEVTDGPVSKAGYSVVFNIYAWVTIIMSLKPGGEKEKRTHD